METQLERIADYLGRMVSANQWWELLLLVIGAFIGVAGSLVGGMVQERRRERKEWKLRPVLQEFDDRSRREADTQLENGLVRYYRIPIKNTGKTTAVKCRGFLWKVERDGHPLDYQDTMPLNWSFMPEETVHEGIIIPPGIPQHLDVVAATRTSSTLKTKPEAIRYRELLATPGMYRFFVYVTAENAEPLEASLDMEVRERQLRPKHNADVRKLHKEKPSH